MQASRRQRRLAKTTGTKTARSPAGLCPCLARRFRTLQAPEPPNRAPRKRPRPSRPRHVVDPRSLFRLQPDLDEAADGGLGFRWNVRLFAAGEKYPLGTNDFHQSFARAESSLYSISRPRLLSSIGHFAFPHRELYVGESPSAFRL